MRILIFSALSILWFSASPAWADFYRYVDKEGTEFFTNDLKQIPQEYRSSATAVKPDESRVSVSEVPAATGKSPMTVREHRDKYGKGEEYWHKKAANLRLKLRDQQGEYDMVVKQLEDQDQKPKKRDRRHRGGGMDAWDCVRAACDRQLQQSADPGGVERR